MAHSAIHPGEQLAEAIEASKITVAQLAREIRVPANRITGVLHGTRAVTADTAIRLRRYLWASARILIKPQTNLRVASGGEGNRGQSQDNTVRQGLDAK